MPKKTAISLTTLWRNFGPNTYPIDMNDLVNGVINKMSDNDELILKYGKFDSFDGMMIPTDSTKKWLALVNSSIPSAGRKNFTAAHEIYHFLAHRTIQDKFECSRGDISGYKKNTLEKEANDFASQLILPPDKIRPRVKECFNYENVKSLADELGASVSAVAYKWLALSTTDIAFVVSRDGFIISGYPSPKAKAKGVFIHSNSELPEFSITAACIKSGVEDEGVADPQTWHPSIPAEERVYLGKDGYTYTFLEFLA